MSQENVEAVKGAVAALNERDIHRYLAGCTEDIEVQTPFAPIAGVYEGAAGVRRYFADIQDRNGRRVWGNRSDWRCTTKPAKLYFTVFASPRSGFDLPRFKNKVKTAYLLIDPEKQPIPMTTGADGIITLQTPRPERTPIANVVVVEIEGDRIER